MNVELKKEITVFVVLASLLGWNAYDLTSDSDSALRRSRSTDSREYHSLSAPDVRSALRDESRRDELGRDLFSPPRDTSPLPLLSLSLPPLEPLEALAPPTAFGPAARHMGPLLRTAATRSPAPGLFGGVEETPEEIQIPEQTVVPDSDLSLEERLARIAARKKLYDWIVLTELKFGHIRNKDRVHLSRTEEPVLFVEVDPGTGHPRYPGQPPIPYERERVQEFGLADTPTNRIELGRGLFQDELRSGDYDGAMRLAAECVDLRNEAERALDVAAELYSKCSRLQPSEARPLLGLARCYELGFQFEKAFDVYKSLTEGELHTEAEPWARLGDLYARFRMAGPAAEAFEEALRRSRSDWVTRWLYGRFLLDRGELELALGHIAKAQQSEPTAPELRSVRVGIRADLGRVLLSLGRLEEARAYFGRARSADPADDLGLAGLYSVAVLAHEDGPEGVLEGELPDASINLLLAMGRHAMQQGASEDAKRYLTLAVAVDPFQAWLAWRALSWLAETTGHPEEALSMIEGAHASNPTDAWTLYQRGRLLAARDDVAGAMQSFQSALDQELDFSDALIAMGVLSRQAGELEAAERYFARALSIDPERPLVHSRRGFNFLQLGELTHAGSSFRRALELDPDLASAHNGLAWWYYVSGNSAEAQTRFAELVDVRRNQPEGDPSTVYAEAQSDRIRDHEGKESWRDRFDRVGRVGNGWSYDQGFGAEVRLREGEVWIEGQLNKESRTRLIRELPADRFLSLEASMTIHPESRDVTVGMFVSRETESRDGSVRTHASIELVRNWDGVMRARLVKKGELDAMAQDLFASTWTVGERMRLRIEKTGEKSSDTVVTLWVDDTPVMQNMPIPTLGRSSQPLRFGVFVEGRGGRTAAVSIDDVVVVRRRL